MTPTCMCKTPLPERTPSGAMACARCNAWLPEIPPAHATAKREPTLAELVRIAAGQTPPDDVPLLTRREAQQRLDLARMPDGERAKVNAAKTRGRKQRIIGAWLRKCERERNIERAPFSPSPKQRREMAGGAGLVVVMGETVRTEHPAPETPAGALPQGDSTNGE